MCGFWLAPDSSIFLPKEDQNDIYFDIEGDPFINDGLEYLFGLLLGSGPSSKFLDIWAHDFEQEKEATQKVIRLLFDTCTKHFGAHIYHYNSYEVNALRKLSQKHQVLEEELDILLRANRFVDLYPIVSKNIITTEAGVSLKDLEIFFLPDRRDTEVQTAASSVVMYEKWIQTQEQQILEEIKLYNEQDCRSLPHLKEWLVKEVFPSSFKFSEPYRLKVEDSALETVIEQDEKTLILDALIKYHKREAKPYWWGHFDALTATDGDLLLDSSVLAACTRAGSDDERLLFRFPEQEHKFSEGDSVTCIMPASDQAKGGVISELDESNGIIKIRSNHPLDNHIHLREIPGPPSKQIEARLKICATAPIPPSVRGCITKITQADYKKDRKPAFAKTISEHPNIHIDGAVTFVQGPPGSGKTFQGALFISNLSNNNLGNLCIVTAQSHNAIENLLSKSADMADVGQPIFIKFGKIPARRHEDIIYITKYDELVYLVNSSLGAEHSRPLILGMTVYAIAKLYNDFILPKADFLIVDEAGQYALANTVACASVSNKVILLGDQNQLPNVVQGTHPFGIGLSVMAFCLGENSVVKPENGLFLEETRRLHPSICHFISDKFYQGKLKAHEDTAKRVLLKNSDKYEEDYSGINLELLTHSNATQKSEKEAIHIRNLISEIKANFKIKNDEQIFNIENKDFIIIAPFNAQVKLLRSTLDDDIPVGTVDKFQGQEAPIAIVSMTSSTGEDAPKGLNFLLNKNRLNVAISRAQISCFVVCSRGLFGSKCNTIEQMELLSLFSSLKMYAKKITG